MGTGADRLYEMLACNHALAGKIAGRDFPQHAFEHLQKWQQTRLTRTFEDLMQQDAYRPAITFFLTELYGGLDFRERDQEMSKVMPVMKRFLPDKVLYIMSEAFELQAVSLEFDIEMAEYMERLDVPDLDMFADQEARIRPGQAGKQADGQYPGTAFARAGPCGGVREITGVPGVGPGLIPEAQGCGLFQ